MTDVAAAEAPADPVPPAPEGAARAPDEVEAEAAEVFDSRVSIPESLGPVRRRILDHMIDTEGDQTMTQIIAGLGNISRNTIESAVRREYEAGRLLRISAGVYRLAPAKPPEQPKPAPSPEPKPVATDGMTDEQWIEALESFFANPASWDVEKFGPSPDQVDNRIPHLVKMRMNDRLRKRAERRKDREAAIARQAEADRQLRDRLVGACNGNYSPDLLTSDLAPVRLMLEIVPVDRVLTVIRSKVDRRCYPGNPPLVSWRDPAFLRAIAESYCRTVVVPGLLDAWSKAGKASQKPTGASEVSSSTPRPAAPEQASTAPPAQSGRKPDDDLGSMGYCAVP